MAIAVFCTLGAVVLALYRYKPQKELGYFLLYLTVLTLWALVIILAPVGSSGWSVFFRRGFFTVTVLAGILLCTALTGAVPVSHGQRLHSLLLTLGYLVLTLIPPSRVRAVGLLLGMGYCLGILMAMYARGSDAALLMLFPCAITIGFRVWVVLPGMHVPFFQESVFFYLFRCARIYDAPFTLGCMAYVCRRYALQFDRAEQLARELDIPREEVVLAMDAIVDPVSLYEPIYSEGGDTVCVMDQVSDRRCTDEGWIQHIALKDAIGHLTPRERSILMLRFGQGKTQMEVSAEIGISQAQVSRLEKGAIRSIKKEL